MARRYLIFTVAIVAVLGLSLVAVHQHGRSSRIFADPKTIGREPVAAVAVNRPEEALRHWSGRYHGRIVLVFDHDWPRIDPTSFYAPTLFRKYPLQVFNLAEKQEQEHLSSETFLYFAALRGTVRDIRAVLSPEAMADIAGRAASAHNARIRPGEVFSSHHGLPRTFFDLAALKAPAEPVLLYVNVGFFRSHEPESLMRRLAELRIATDSLVVCLSPEDSSISDRERERLRTFVALAGRRS